MCACGGDSWVQLKRYEASAFCPFFILPYSRLSLFSHVILPNYYQRNYTLVNHHSLSTSPPSCMQTHLNKPDICSLLSKRLTTHIQSILANNPRLLLLTSNNTVLLLDQSLETENKSSKDKCTSVPVPRSLPIGAWP